ncbi:MAG: threonine--tRNA ligase [Candidatus Aenigmarchaeota archaeon]|nr:threonine--tRNA ligase [Candidatus Aenigmarchaeota archaeon]
MKILLIHSDFLEFEPREKAIKQAEESSGRQKIEECLVVFTAVEKSDEGNVEQAASNLADEVKKVAEEVKAKNIVLYPYAHLSKELASPGIALDVLKSAEALLKKEYKVTRAPFGWYKAFTIKCKGHPLSELSREITAGKPKELVSESLKEEEKVRSTWYILTPDGKLDNIEIKDKKIDGFNFSKHKNLEKFAIYEMAKSREVKEEPPHVKLMRKLEIADYEEGSDSGNLRFYPKGRIIKALLEAWATQKAISYGAMEVETPLMYDFEHPALKDYLNRFPARQYVVESMKKKFFLRFSACFGQFLMKAQTNISYRNLPLKMYELARSFRLEKPGELTGLRRLRAFTMPDMHTLCRDLEEARKEFASQFTLAMECMKDIEIDDYETAIRFTEDFWKANKEFVLSLVGLVNKPVLIEIWNRRFAYFDPKFEFNIIDAIDKASALATVQIDHENAQRYGIQYTDADNKKKYPVILHCSPSGGIERVMYALLEKAYMKGKNATLPLWLSPTQVRVCPVNDSFIKDAESIADELEKECIRADVDDRTESINKKIRDAEMEWVPLIVVLGSKEKQSGKLAVRFRDTGKVENLEKKELIKRIHDKIKGFPYKSLTLPRLLSKRPIFFG